MTQMALPTDRYHRLHGRWICFACFLIIQLSWILPCTFILLSESPTPRTLITEDQNVGERIQAKGFSGAIKVFQDHELAALQSLYDDWNSFLPQMKERLSSNGFTQSLDRTCFLWLPACFTLAQDERILQIVTEAIGPRVLLYGMTVWKGKNEAFQWSRWKAEVGDCGKSIDFVFGASVQLVSQSHKVSRRLLQVVLRTMQSMEDESRKFSSKKEEFDFLERSFIARVKRIVRSADVGLEILELDDNYGVFFHGGTLHRIGDAFQNRTGLLLQYISADCKVREEQKSVWGLQGTSSSLYLPPTLLVAGDPTKRGAVNDVRTSLSQEHGLISRDGHGNHSIAHLMGKDGTSGNNIKFPEIQSAIVFSESQTTLDWEDKGPWRMRKIGEASTSVMAKVTIERFLLVSTSSMDFDMAVSDGEQVIVVLSNRLLYTRAFMEGDFQHHELLELRPGSAALLSNKVLHTLAPLESEAGIMSLHWIGHENNVSPGSTERDDARVTRFNIDGHFGTKATEGCTISLGSGQAYDPDNTEFCDVIVFVVEGSLLQVLPLNIMLQAFDVLLIPARQPCVLWNIGGRPVKFFAMHVCHIEDEMQAMTSFGSGGKVF